MKPFNIYSLVTGNIVATHYAEDPRDVALYRGRLERQLGEPLSSLRPVNPEADKAHIRLMVDRYRMQQEATQ